MNESKGDTVAAALGDKRLLRWMLVLLPPFVVLVVRSLLWSLIHPYVWFLFYTAVFLSQWIGGLRGGIVATAVSTASVLWFFIPPEHTFLKAPQLYFPASVFFTMGVVIGVFHDRLRKTVTALGAKIQLASSPTICGTRSRLFS